MTNYLEVPLIAGLPDQQLDITLEGEPLSLQVIWNERFGYWSLSVYRRTGEAIIVGVKMVKDFPLLQQTKPHSPPGEFIFFDNASGKSRPDFYSVGGDHQLIYISKN